MFDRLSWEQHGDLINVVNLQQLNKAMEKHEDEMESPMTSPEIDMEGPSANSQPMKD